MLTCSIERRENVFLLRANDRLLPLYAYMTYQPAKGCYQSFRTAGVQFVSVAVYAGDRGINPATGIRPFRPGFMKAPGIYDFSHADEDFRRAVGSAAPGEAYILPRLMLEMPIWWEETHPEAQCRDSAGTPSHCSFSSEVWLNAAVEAMERFNAWLNESGWNEYIVGWHIAAGSTEEYIRPVLHQHQYLDYSACSQEAYRRWLHEKYGNIAALNRMWNTSYASFGETGIPLPAERAYPACGDLRDPASERHVMDFYDFYGDEIARFVSRLCAEGKRITGNAKLMGAFYGNVGICEAELSHNSMHLLLEDGNVDFFASPFCYTEARGQTVDWPFQATLESASLHGKPWFVEADVRTLLSRPISQAMPASDPVVNRAYDGPVWWGPENMEQSVGDMLRAFSRIITHNGAMWWFDMWGGWYEAEPLMAFQKWARDFYEKTALSGGLSSRAQLAVFLDEKTLNAVSPRMAHAVCSEQFIALGNLGAPYDAYLLSDFERVDPASYRTALLLSPHTLTDGQKRHMEKWKSDGRTVIFSGYTSFFSGKTGEETDVCSIISEEIVSLSAFFGRIPYQCSGSLELAPLNASTGKTPLCCEALRAPKLTLFPTRHDIVLSVSQDGEPAAVLHRGHDHQTLWSAVPCLPAELIREALLLSGGHIYCHTGENVYAGGDYVAVHACTDGVKRVYLPRMGKAFDVFTGEQLPGTELWVEMEMKAGESRMLRMELAE